MRRLPYAALAAIFLVAGSQGAPIDVYGALPSVDNVAISPDGRYLAYTAAADNQQIIGVRDLDSQKLVAAVRAASKVRDVAWADNDHLLIVTSTASPVVGVRAPKSEWSLAQTYSISTQKQVPLLEHAHGRDAGDDGMNVIAGPVTTRMVDGHAMIFITGISFVNQTGVATLYKYDVDENRTTLVEVGTQSTLAWTVDGDGNPVAREDYDENTQTWRLKTHTTGLWRDAVSYPAAIDMPEVIGLTPDGSGLIFAMPEADDQELKLADNTVAATTSLGNDYNSIVQDPATHRVTGTIRYGTTTVYRFVAPADQRAWNSVVEAFSGENVELISWSTDRKRIVVRVDGAHDGAVYELIDMNTNHATVLGPVYQGIGPGDLSQVSYIGYHAADGLEIPAYLTLPAGRPAKNLPLIVLPHGGPAASDGPQFDWLAQGIASRGYAVLQPQFRGSTTKGTSFLKAGFGEWGRKMQSDLSDGVRFLAGQGTIDPKRVCIMGASYGGYAALAGVTLQQGIYRCAVAIAGVSDPHDFLRWERGRADRSDSLAMRYWTRFMGVEDRDDPKLAEISPLSHAASVDVPVLLIHGKDDTVVPIQQSEEMADALNDAHKTVRFVRLDGEDHWMSRSQTRQQMLSEAIAFLEANNPPN